MAPRSTPPPSAEPLGRTQAVYYRDRKGAEPVDQFIEDLLVTAPAAAKIDDFVDEYLNDRRADAPEPEFPISSQIDGELRELRVRFAKTRYRVLYRRSANLVVLLHAIEKDTPAVPDADIAIAQRRWDDFRARMDARPRTHRERQATTPRPRDGGRCSLDRTYHS